MNLANIKKFAEEERLRLKGYYQFEQPQQMSLAITVKIAEELGELCQEVLAHSGLQRKEKLEQIDKTNPAEEFADVILTTFILAQNLGIDVEAGLKNKMKKIEARYHHQ